MSGGPDSMALLILARLAGCAVTAYHVDHGLRPESAGEALVVARVAARLGAGFRSLRAEVAEGPNLEARARAARFAVLPVGVATGHTMDDQAETVILNVLRGAGLDGMAGMRPGRAHPLLGIRRAEAKAVCQAAGVEWVEDPSNADPRFWRNRVRRELLPLWAEISGRDPVPLLARQADVVRAERDLLEEWGSKAVEDPAAVAALRVAPLPLARRAVRGWLREEVPGGPPPSLAEVTRVLHVAAGRIRATEVAGRRRVSRHQGRLTLEPPGSGKVLAMDLEPGAEPAPHWARPSVGPALLSAEALAGRVAELGREITADYAGDPPLLVGVLKGAMIFMSDLSRAIDLPVDVDFMAVSSYGSATRTSGVVRIVKDLDADLVGRRVLVVEDIVDSGLTLNYLRRYLQARQPTSVEVCALLVKEGVQRIATDLRYVGFTIPSTFVVGYGLDVDERFRNLRGVHAYGPASNGT